MIRYILSHRVVQLHFPGTEHQNSAEVGEVGVQSFTQEETEVYAKKGPTLSHNIPLHLILPLPICGRDPLLSVLQRRKVRLREINSRIQCPHTQWKRGKEVSIYREAVPISKPGEQVSQTAELVTTCLVRSPPACQSAWHWICRWENSDLSSHMTTTVLSPCSTSTRHSLPRTRTKPPEGKPK